MIPHAGFCANARKARSPTGACHPPPPSSPVCSGTSNSVAQSHAFHIPADAQRADCRDRGRWAHTRDARQDDGAWRPRPKHSWQLGESLLAGDGILPLHLPTMCEWVTCSQAAWRFVKYHLVSRDKGNSKKASTAKKRLYPRPRRITARALASILLKQKGFNHGRTDDQREAIFVFALTLCTRFFNALDQYLEEDCTALDLSADLGHDVMVALAEEGLSLCPALGGNAIFGERSHCQRVTYAGVRCRRVEVQRSCGQGEEKSRNRRGGGDAWQASHSARDARATAVPHWAPRHRCVAPFVLSRAQVVIGPELADKPSKEMIQHRKSGIWVFKDVAAHDRLDYITKHEMQLMNQFRKEQLHSQEKAHVKDGAKKVKKEGIGAASAPQGDTMDVDTKSSSSGDSEQEGTVAISSAPRGLLAAETMARRMARTRLAGNKDERDRALNGLRRRIPHRAASTYLYLRVQSVPQWTISIRLSLCSTSGMRSPTRNCD